VATWVSEHSMQNNSAWDFMNKCSQYIYQWNFADMIYWPIYISMQMHRSSSWYRSHHWSTQEKITRLSCALVTVHLLHHNRFFPAIVVLKRYVGCWTISKRQPYSNKNSVYPNALIKLMLTISYTSTSLYHDDGVKNVFPKSL